MKLRIILVFLFLASSASICQIVGTSIQQFGVLPTNDPETNKINMQKAIDQAAVTGSALFIEPVEKPYPIVIADAYPTQHDVWQSTKAVSGAAAITAAGGRLILLAHSPEGVANHPAYAEYIGQTPETLKQMMADKALQDPVACALAYDISRLRKNFRISLVSHGLTKTDAGRMKFDYFETLEAAVESAHVETGGSDIAILTHGGISWPYLGRSDAG